MTQETKWTPGPWTLSADTSPRVMGPSKHGENVVAKVYFREFTNLTQANAHLIAAAPELYEALKEAQKDFCERHCADLDGDHWEECTDMQAALAKARGDQS